MGFSKSVAIEMAGRPYVDTYLSKKGEVRHISDPASGLYVLSVKNVEGHILVDKEVKQGDSLWETVVDILRRCASVDANYSTYSVR